MRIFATIGVVLIHTVYPVYSRPDFLGGTSWWIANALNAVSRTSIPLFLMLSGYLILPKNETSIQNVIRTSRRLLVPLLIWFALYVWWDEWYLTKHHTFLEIALMFFSSSMYHLYFLVILTGLYLLLPVWRLIIKASSQTTWYITNLALAVGVCLFFLQYALFPTFSLLNSFTIWLPYVGYFLLGHILADKSIHSLRQLWFMLVLGLTLTFGYGYVNVWFVRSGFSGLWFNGVSYFDQYLSPNVVLMSVALFQLMLHSSVIKIFAASSSLLQTVIKQLSKVSFAVYLVHFMVLNVLDFRYRYAIEFLDGDILTYLLSKCLLAVTGSFAAALVLIKIPLLKFIFGEK